MGWQKVKGSLTGGSQEAQKPFGQKLTKLAGEKVKIYA